MFLFFLWCWLTWIILSGMSTHSSCNVDSFSYMVYFPFIYLLILFLNFLQSYMPDGSGAGARNPAAISQQNKVQSKPANYSWAGYWNQTYWTELEKQRRQEKKKSREKKSFWFRPAEKKRSFEDPYNHAFFAGHSPLLSPNSKFLLYFFEKKKKKTSNFEQNNEFRGTDPLPLKVDATVNLCGERRKKKNEKIVCLNGSCLYFLWNLKLCFSAPSVYWFIFPLLHVWKN